MERSAQRQQRLAGLGLAGGVALHATNVYVATTILPSVVHDIGGLELYAWNTTLFVVASILGSVLSVRLLAVLGARSAYFSALAVFALGTVVCASAPSMLWMLAGRTLQGLGGGILLALSYALIRVGVRRAPVAARDGTGVGHVGRCDVMRAGGRRHLRATRRLAAGVLGVAAGRAAARRDRASRGR